MATTIDLDEYLGERIDITKHGEIVYSLRKDVPARVLLACFMIRSMEDRLKAAPEGLVDLDDQFAFAQRALDAYIADVHAICLQIIQHSYPSETSAELNQKLSESDQDRIVRSFFIRLSPESNPLPAATGETSNGTGKTTTTHNGGNRAARRNKVSRQAAVVR